MDNLKPSGGRLKFTEVPQEVHRIHKMFLRLYLQKLQTMSTKFSDPITYDIVNRIGHCESDISVFVNEGYKANYYFKSLF